MLGLPVPRLRGVRRSLADRLRDERLVLALAVLRLALLEPDDGRAFLRRRDVDRLAGLETLGPAQRDTRDLAIRRPMGGRRTGLPAGARRGERKPRHGAGGVAD